MQQKLISRAVVKEKGVPVGYVHLWNYKGIWKERKVAPKTWLLRFRASKKKTNLKGNGGLPIGSKIRWKIIAIQDAVKLADGLYMTDMKGLKKMVGVQINNKREVVRKMPKVFKTPKGSLIKYVNGVKYYYSRTLKKWVRSKYQPKKKKVVKKRKLNTKQKVYLAERKINNNISRRRKSKKKPVQKGYLSKM